MKNFFFLTRSTLLRAADAASFLKQHGLNCALRQDDQGAIVVRILAVPFVLLELFDLNDSEAFKQQRQFLLQYFMEVVELFSSKIKSEPYQPVTPVPRALQAILAAFACKGAIKFDDNIDHLYFEHMLRKWAFCRDPWHCAHGRPTAAIVKLSSKLTHYSSGQTNEAINLPIRFSDKPLKTRQFLLN